MDISRAISERAEWAIRCFSTIVEKATEGIAVLDADSIIKYVNTAWLRMHGYAESRELVGKHISFLHTDEQMRTDAGPFLDEARRRGQFSGPVERKRRDGTILSTETTIFVLKEEQDRDLSLIVFATDSSERDAMRRQVRQWHSRLAEKDDELDSVKQQLIYQAGERMRAEHCLNERSAELNEAKDEIERQCKELSRKEERLAKMHKMLERAMAEENSVKEQLRNEIGERRKMETRLESQTGDLAVAHKQLKEEVTKLKRREVEYLEDVFVEGGITPKKGGLKQNELKALSKMAKKFVET